MYDPLVSTSIPRAHEQQVESYWAAAYAAGQTQRTMQHTTQPLPEQVDTLIIGAGYTGLNAAYQLVTDYQQKVLVLDAGAIGAGCSSRNAGFVLPGTGRLSFSDYERQFGLETAHQVQNEFAASIDHLSAAVEGAEKEVELNEAQYLRFAHTEKWATMLRSQQKLYGPTLLTANWLSQASIKERFPGITHAFGGLSLTPAKSINPIAYVHHLAKRATNAGALIQGNSPVVNYKQSSRASKEFVVETAQGTKVRCQKLLFCTNGYLPQGLNPALSARHLPVLSSVLVTAPLTTEQRNAVGFSPKELFMDTRLLKYYYRLLPDGRLLFGGRGAIQGKHANHSRYQRDLQQALVRTLPTLASVTVDYYWQGWISVALDSMPRVFSPEPNVYTSMGYCGAGIAFSSLAGKRLASFAMNDSTPNLPFYRSALPAFPLPKLKRFGQWLFYQYGQWRD
ncbi:NAD(P)/FAD-dependent oxidoreductase [Aliidiomarina celeris]|uniref:NAD(P)/FAD-dependent oxidoreductase n=1 Tax=Aliidiomarina celeris TaxID=2249428 RepID=UPI000DEA2299|nr:FAD-binding oxidoreductase [Aliidiomarina celeris]